MWVALFNSLNGNETENTEQWYRADWDYGQTTVAFLCAGIAVAMIFNIHSIYRRRSNTK